LHVLSNLTTFLQLIGHLIQMGKTENTTENVKHGNEIKTAYFETNKEMV